MQAFWTALGLIFLMEMGDKSQLVIMALATRYSWKQVLLGLTLASALVHGLAVAVGGLLGNLIPMTYVKTLAGLAFLAFAWLTLRASAEEDEEGAAEAKGGLLARMPALAIALAFCLSEFGDKTQLATVAATAESGAPWLTWAGATLGMVAADSLGIIVGRLLQRVPSWVVKSGSSAIFIVFGWTSLGETWGLAPLWRYTGLATLACAWLLLVWRQRGGAVSRSEQISQ